MNYVCGWLGQVGQVMSLVCQSSSLTFATVKQCAILWVRKFVCSSTFKLGDNQNALNYDYDYDYTILAQTKSSKRSGFMVA